MQMPLTAIEVRLAVYELPMMLALMPPMIHRVMVAGSHGGVERERHPGGEDTRRPVRVGPVGATGR
jgi:hypothetical protein